MLDSKKAETEGIRVGVRLFLAALVAVVILFIVSVNLYGGTNPFTDSSSSLLKWITGGSDDGETQEETGEGEQQDWEDQFAHYDTVVTISRAGDSETMRNLAAILPSSTGFEHGGHDIDSSKLLIEFTTPIDCSKIAGAITMWKQKENFGSRCIGGTDSEDEYTQVTPSLTCQPPSCSELPYQLFINNVATNGCYHIIRFDASKMISCENNLPINPQTSVIKFEN